MRISDTQINLPFFRKRISHGMTEYLAMITEGFTLEVTTSDTVLGVFTWPSTLDSKQPQIVQAYEIWEKISENEFLTVHAKALEDLSLRPKMVSTH